jgi:hypothetical protein
MDQRNQTRLSVEAGFDLEVGNIVRMCETGQRFIVVSVEGATVLVRPARWYENHSRILNVVAIFSYLAFWVWVIWHIKGNQ